MKTSMRYTCFFLLAILLMAFVLPGYSQYAAEFKILPDDGAADDLFGRSVSIEGEYAIVGADQDDDHGSSSGSAYIFRRNAGGDWVLVKKLTASDAASGDFFGRSVAMSGNYAIVGANAGDGNVSNSGSAYVFSRNQGGSDNWGQVAKLTASDGSAEDKFGWSVALSGDWAIVGAYNDDDNGEDSGSAYVFSRNQGGSDHWGQVAKLTASDGSAEDKFGWSVALSGDWAIVGAYGDDDNGESSGSAYIFNRNQGGSDHWGQVAKLTASDGVTFDQFGFSVALNGDDAIVSAYWDTDNGVYAGSAYIFNRNQGGSDHWGQVTKLTASDGAAYDMFGYSVAISGDYAIVGAHNDDDHGSNSGSAYIFSRNQGGSDHWGQLTKLTASDGAEGDYFGRSVAICGDYAISGASSDDDNGSNSGSVYVYGPQFTDISASLIGINYGSVAWGDYDNDGDLDILLTGYDGNHVAKVYRNAGSVFTDIGAVLTGVQHSSVAWGDYDNDGDLDILIAGISNAGKTAKVYRNDGGVFTDIGAGLSGVDNCAAAWGDYDNDGDLDILLTGVDTGDNQIAKVYRNDSGVFSDIGAGLTGVYWSSVAWGDYDNDGDLDILLSGDNSQEDRIARVYRNDGGAFIDIGAGLTGVYSSAVAWGDYDNDGDLDILLTGESRSGYVAIVYENTGSGFVDIGAGLSGVRYSSVAWGDYDNDGDLDILLTGSDAEWNRIAQVYRNDGGAFSDIGADLTGVFRSSVAWGDYDNDGDLDILLTGRDNASNYIAKIYRNNSAVFNIVPSAPGDLSAAVTGDEATLAWNAASDAQTPSAGLTYNLLVGTTSNGVDVNSPMANVSNGWRRVVQLGGTNHNESWTLKNLPVGDYFWRVQAVDAAFAGSPFSAQATFSVGSAEMDVQGNGASIADGDDTPSTSDDTDFGEVEVAAGAVEHTFTIENTGNAELNLTGGSPLVVVTGDGFSLVTDATTPVAADGGTTTFTIRFEPTAAGVASGAVSIANDDADENPYDFAIQGTGIAASDWTELAPSSAPSPRNRHLMAYAGNGQIVLHGGYDNANNLNDTWLFNIASQTWQSRATGPQKRGGSAMAFIGDGKVLMYGGKPVAPRSSSTETWLYEVSANKWTKLTPSGTPPGLVNHALCYIGTNSDGRHQVLLFGGRFSLTDTRSDQTWVFTLWQQSGKWTGNWEQQAKSGAWPSARVNASLSYAGGRQAVLFGGHDGSNELGDTWQYDLANPEWLDMQPDDAPAKRYNHCAAYLGGDQIVLFGGRDDSLGTNWEDLSTIYDDTWIYTLGANTWMEDDNNADTPQARASAGLAETSLDGGSRVVLFGGNTDAGPLADTWTFGGGDYLAKGNVLAEPGSDDTDSENLEHNEAAIPSEFVLEQNYPNPFNPGTEICYALPYDAVVSLKVYDILGQEVKVLVEGAQPAGTYRVAFDGQGLASGIYIYAITVRDNAGNSFAQMKRMILMK